ncbi:hypothetical protein [Spirosoma rigui]|uniref:hypothetical protein n=1 Tax=Spirosoma rigui TaxID=564064 RepID=UPI0009B0F920|nr:hypothetical protein [Spirosoma rigui]
MRTFSLLPALSMLLVLCLASCKSTFLLKENFSGDSVGSDPIKNIPGDPAGDSVSYTSVLSPRLTVQSSTVTTGQKALVFSEASIPGATSFNQWLSFKGIVSDYSQPIWFYWTAKQRASQSDILIDIMGVQGLWVTRFKIRHNGQLVRIIDYATEQTVDVLGTFDPQQVHTIIISLQPTARKYNITVFGLRESNSATRTNLNVLTQPNPSGPVFSFEKPSINFRYLDGGFSAASAYILEGVYITRKKPN